MPAAEQLLVALRDGGATDLHLRGGVPPCWRVNGDLLPHGDPLPAGEDFEALLLELLAIARLERLPDSGDLDFTFRALEGRFRAHVFPSEEGLNAVIRKIPSQVADPARLGLPEPVRALTAAGSGLVLVCGSSGCGKTTTVASLLEAISSASRRYIVTVEDPVEYVIAPCLSVVHQISVGTDAPSFSAGLKTALSARADVIYVGDLREAETVRLALHAAETGALVFATLHANGAVEALDRLLDLLPQEQHAVYRAALAQGLRMVLYQVLLPARTGGMVPATEIITGTRAVQGLLRENKTHELVSAIQSGRASGMRSLDDSLEELLAARTLAREEALAHARNRSRFEQKTHQA